MATVKMELSVCVDCVLIIANDEGHAGHRARMDMYLGDDCRALAMACPEDCEGEFSTRPCEGCGSPYSGDRHPAVVLV